MLTRLNDLTKAAIFYGLTFTLALAVALVSPGGRGNLTEIGSMLTPTIALLLMLLVVTRDGRMRGAWPALGASRMGANVWIAAIALPTIVLLASHAIVWRTGYADAGLPADSGVPDLAINTVVNFAVVFVFALAEEIGWRGYLLPHLLPLGTRRAVLLTGLLHGIFHMPLILLTPFYHQDGNKLITVPLFLLSLTMAGAIYGYLRLTTASVWPAAIAHSTLNVVWNLCSALTVAASPVAVEYLAGESGLLPLLGYTAIAAWCLSQLAGQTQPVTQRNAPTVPATVVQVR